MVWVTLALAGLMGVAACGSGPGSQAEGSPRPATVVTVVTAVAATVSPRSSWNSVAARGRGTQVGPWKLKSRFLVLSALADQGLATVTRNGETLIVFRGDLSIRSQLRQQGWGHVGDPDAWHGYVFDAYQAKGPADEKLFEVTTPTGVVHDFVHPLALKEQPNNSFVAVTPGGRWMVSAGWGVLDHLLVFPSPIINPAAPVGLPSLPLAATISLDHPVRNIQGCVFTRSTRLLCSTDDPGTDLWPVSRQLLQISLPYPLVGRSISGHVTSLGGLPTRSDCAGTYEVEGIDYQAATDTLRVEVRPPGKCGLATAVYNYKYQPKT